MSEHRDEHLDLCAAYALGSLDAADRQRLEEHLAGGCPVCEAALADFSAATVMLAASAPAAMPTAALRDRVLNAARAESGAAGTRGEEDLGGMVPRRAGDVGPARAGEAPRGTVVEMRPRRPALGFTIAWAAAAAALAIATALSWNAAERLKNDLNATRQQLAEAQQQLEIERRWAAIMNAPDARVAELTITPDGIAALRARATYDPRSRGAVLVFENFTPPSGRDYELWALRPDGVASLGVIKPDASGNAVVRLADAGDPSMLAGFAVSLEPEGGSPNPSAPSGPVVMAGKFGAE